jgi:hypothetical protein
MAETRNEEWREIAQAIQNETDSQKLQQLVEKLCQVLDGRLPQTSKAATPLAKSQ